MDGSEIARLRREIEQELESMRLGLVGFAAGHARHAFIHARMDRVGSCRDQLAYRLGDRAARQIVYQIYDQTMERELPTPKVVTPVM